MIPKENAKLQGIPTTEEEIEKAAAKFHLSVKAYKRYLEARAKAGPNAGILDRQMRDIFWEAWRPNEKVGKVNPPPKFLSVESVLIFHAVVIEDQGGDATVRDMGALQSAIAMPMQQFSGNYLHEDIPAMAAAYAYHICLNHPFLDGNKRVATAAMIAFLSQNGWNFDATDDEAEPIVIQLASGQLNKPTFTAWVRKQVHEKAKMELREFFSLIDPDQFTERFRSLLPGETGASPRELQQRFSEAAQAIPLLSRLAIEQQEARAAGDEATWERVTFLAVGMTTLHAMAEDLGYEW